MLRLFVLLFSFFSFLFACGEGYPCKQKIIDSQAVITQQNIDIFVKKDIHLLYSHQKPAGQILKYDPFLSLYLVKTQKIFPYPFSLNHQKYLPLIALNQNGIIQGKIKQKQIGLNQLGVWSKPFSSCGLLLTSCCLLEGLLTPKGIITKPYLQKFIYSKQTTYADIGIRVQEQNGRVVVCATDPFHKSFLVGDVIIKHNGENVKDGASFMQDILLSQVGKEHRILIQRKGKFLLLKVKSFVRYGGGEISDTFLEQKGIFFDTHLFIIKLTQKAKHYGLEVGDKVLQINTIKVKNQKEFRQALSSSLLPISLLISRNHFEFFITLKEI